MVSGRLREYDRDQIAKDLIEWAKKPDSINLNKFCCSYPTPFSPKKISAWSFEDEFFRESVEIAKAFLGARREEWLNQEILHVKGYDLNASTYDYFLKEEKRIQAEFESSLRKDEEGVKQTTYNITVPNDLAIGSNIPATTIPNKGNTSSK